jgi:hypothetical protein
MLKVFKSNPLIAVVGRSLPDTKGYFHEEHTHYLLVILLQNNILQMEYL